MTAEEVDVFLEHFGVKGQKWGVRRAEKKSAKADKKWQKNIYSVPGAFAVHNAAADLFNSRVTALNAKHPKADMLLRPDTAATKRYIKEAEEISAAAFKQAVKDVHGTSPSGKLKATIDTSNPDQYKIVVSPVDIEHATEALPEFIFEIEIGEDGLISSLRNVKDESVAQSDLDVDIFLGHFGVKGQKWGVRRKERAPINPSADWERHSKAKKKKSKELSDQELRNLLDRLNMEQRYRKQFNPSAVKKGVMVVGAVLAVGNTMNQVANFASSPAGKIIAGKLAKKAVSA